MPLIASGFLRLLPKMAFATLLLTSAPLLGQGNAPANQNAKDNLPDLKIPTNASVEQLQAIVAKAKRIAPNSPQQYQAMQTAIRDASKKLVEKLKADPDSAAHRQAELDAISASVSLMTFFGPDAQKKTLEQIHEFLKNRKKLSIEDAQTGIMAAAMLELQPNKRPAKSTYELLYELLKDDEREDMQSLRVNLEANIRRLSLLGNPFELEAKTLDGKKLEIKDYAGKFVLVSFFTTWCKPYLDEIPRLKSNYKKYHGKGLEIIAISLDQDKKALNKHLKAS
ncbi:MAG: TlpA disulfide reductase family protein, partial [Planctomycetota bacterium]